MSHGWEIDPPYKAYDVYESCFNREDELEREEPEYNHDEKLIWELEEE